MSLAPCTPPPAVNTRESACVHSSFFQSVCVLGYCVFPLVIASALSLFVRNSAVRTIAVVAAYLWSTRASVVFMGSMVPEDRRVLAVFPVCLFYLVMAWMVYVQ